MLSQRNRLLATAFLVLALTLFGGVAAFGAPTDDSIQDQPYLGVENAPVNPQEPAGSSTFAMLARVIGSLAVIAVFSYGVLWFMKKKLGPGGGASQWMGVVDQLTLGPNKGLYITRIGGRYFVVGVTDQSIQKIMEIDDETLIDELQREEEEGPGDEGDLWQRWSKLLDASRPKKVSKDQEDDLSFHREMGRQLSRLSELEENKGAPDIISPRGREEDR